jgi:hypothetical protein
MSDGQLGFSYALVLFFGIIVGGAFQVTVDIPMDAQQHADKMCQELYGPQVGAKWVDGQIMCETVRGEIVPVKEPA